MCRFGLKTSLSFLSLCTVSQEWLAVTIVDMQEAPETLHTETSNWEMRLVLIKNVWATQYIITKSLAAQKRNLCWNTKPRVESPRTADIFRLTHWTLIILLLQVVTVGSTYALFFFGSPVLFYKKTDRHCDKYSPEPSSEKCKAVFHHCVLALMFL